VPTTFESLGVQFNIFYQWFISLTIILCFLGLRRARWSLLEIKIHYANSHPTRESTLHSEKERHDSFSWNRFRQNLSFCTSCNSKSSRKPLALLRSGFISNKRTLHVNRRTFRSNRCWYRTQKYCYRWWFRCYGSSNRFSKETTCCDRYSRENLISHAKY